MGKLTRKDLGLHKLVSMDDILLEGTEVGYYVRGKRLLLEGYIKDSGIYCHCCNSVVSPSQFEAHAGWASRRKPYNNIYTSNGVSLHELSVSLSKGRKLTANENDDLCSICADGGDLLLCDLYPRAFHKAPLVSVDLFDAGKIGRGKPLFVVGTGEPLESFYPIVDAVSGRDHIPSMVYGREDFGGMYCVVLIVNSSVVSVGVLRVLGDVAELPLVATSRESQGLPNAVRVWVDIVKVKDAAIWRPSSEIECMEDAIGTTIAWPEDKVVVF